MKTSLKGRYELDKNAGAATVGFGLGDVKLRATLTDATVVKGPSMNGLALAVEKPGFFIIDYNVPKKIPQIGTFVQKVLWHFVHFLVSVGYAAVGVVIVVESYIISKGWLKRYENLNISKVKYLGIVVESEDARRTFEVIELLMWLRKLGVKQVCLYDVEGVLKQSKDVIVEKLGNASLFGVTDDSDSLRDEKHMSLEFASISDGKEVVAKAANVLLKKLKSEKVDEVQDVVFTEQDMFDALKSIGYGAPDPDLLLIYAPARCHLGFPAWRLRYTEIVHMNPLKCKKYGSLIKAIYKFTIVRQNYGK